MSSGFFNEIERLLKVQADDQLEHLLMYFGVDLEISKIQEGVQSKVYGTMAGGNAQKIKEIVGILVGDDFFPTDEASGGGFIRGYLYTKDLTLTGNMIVSIKGQDQKSRRYQIVQKESKGITTDVFTRYVVSSLGE